jgi:hypothetical protein
MTDGNFGSFGKFTRPSRYEKNDEFIPLDLVEPYSSFNSHQVTKKRSTGSIDFKFQTDRPAFPINSLQEHRFQNINKMPKVLAAVKHTPRVEFEKQMDRDAKLMYNIKMGETCYSHKMMD